MKTQRSTSGKATRAAVLLAGLVLSAVVPVARAAVSIDQIPLTAQQSLAPDIVLMIDDSGSMAWSVMPDYSYLSDTSTQGMRDSSVNGVYYDPTVTYTTPPTATGGSFSGNAAASFPNAYSDPVGGSTSTVDVTQASGTFGDSNGSNSGTLDFYETLSYSCGRRCTSTFNAFAYTGSDGQTHYVASDCHGQSNCVVATDATGTSAPSGIAAGQNVMNWYSYYSSRIKLAKSGVLGAFASLDPTIRLGFGSTNGSRATWIGSNIGSSLRYGFSTDTKSSNYLADVQPFGDGSSGTQKSNLWSWASGLSAANSTPLRQALNAVGHYYTTDQPWQTSSNDSTKLACRQAYSILTTDGFWNDGSVSIPSNPYNDNMDGGPGANVTSTSSYDATPNCSIGFTYNASSGFCEKGSGRNRQRQNPTWTCPSGGTYQSSYQSQSDQCVVTTSSTGPAITITGPNSQSFTYNAIAPYKDDNPDTLADVAAYYWLTDLQTSLANEVPVSAEDPAFWQHMATFTLGLGFAPTGLSPSGTTIQQVFNWAEGGPAITGFGWPTPAANSAYNIADLAHAAVDGHGGFYSALSPQAFSSGLADALRRVQERVGTGASLAANSATLQTGTVTYQALYYTGKWKGNLLAYSVDPGTGAISSTPTWTASSALPPYGSRNVWTYSGSAMVRFSSPSSLSTAEQNALGADAASRQNVINYLLGDASNEQKNNGSYRDRDTALGDIVNSQPVYVGPPNPNLFYGKTFTGASSYPAFASAQIGRTGAIWVAANDGALHGFDASTGRELFAYLPGAVITGGIKNLSDPNYGGVSVPHQFYNDGQLSVADVYVGGAWKTVLVGTTGRGPAKAVYALDVTDPANPSFLWERASADGLSGSNYIGQIVGPPVIAQTADGTWSVLIGNGYNSTQNNAALLQFALSDGSLSVHATNATANNGLASPAVWMADSTNGISTKAYAGDLFGNVWSADVTSASSTATLLYVAKDSAGNTQPITAGLLIGKDPATGNLWLFFGTGRYLTQSDLASTSAQTWYGLIVQLGATPGGEVAVTSSSTRTNLKQRSITAEQAANLAANPPTLGERTVSIASTGDMNAKAGWYLDLLNPNLTPGNEGERMVTSNQFQGTLLIGTSRIPQSSDPCNPSGRGWIMAVDPFTGGNPASVFFDINGDRAFDNSDKMNGNPIAGLGFGALPNNPIFVGNTMLTSFDNATTSSILTSGSIGLLRRVSWRELLGR